MKYNILYPFSFISPTITKIKKRRRKCFLLLKTTDTKAEKIKRIYTRIYIFNRFSVVKMKVILRNQHENEPYVSVCFFLLCIIHRDIETHSQWLVCLACMPVRYGVYTVCAAYIIIYYILYVYINKTKYRCNCVCIVFVILCLHFYFVCHFLFAQHTTQYLSVR